METISYKTPTSLIGCSEQLILDKLPGTITSYCFSSDGQVLLLADNKQEVWKWNLASKSLDYFITPFPGLVVTSMAYTPDLKHVAIGAYDSTQLLIASADKGEIKASYDVPMGCHQIAFHPNSHLVGVLASRSISILETYTGKQLHVEEQVDPFGYAVHGKEPVVGLMWTNGGSCLLTCTSTGVLRLFDVLKGELIHEAKVGMRVQELQTNPSGSLVLLHCCDRALVLDTLTLQLTSTVYDIKPRGLFTTAFADAGFRIGHLYEGANLLGTYAPQQPILFPEDQRPERVFSIEELSKGTVKANTVLFSPAGDYCLCFDRTNAVPDEAVWLLINL